MRSLSFCVFALALACGGGAPEPKNPTPTTELKKPTEANVGDRTTCPVSNEVFVVKADSLRSEYKGKTVYFCCPGCKEKFDQDPAKYLGH